MEIIVLPKTAGMSEEGYMVHSVVFTKLGLVIKKACRKEKQVSTAFTSTQSYMRCIYKNIDRNCLFSPLSNMSNCFHAGVLASKLFVCSGRGNISCDFSHPGISPRFRSCSSQLNATSYLVYNGSPKKVKMIQK